MFSLIYCEKLFVDRLSYSVRLMMFRDRLVLLMEVKTAFVSQRQGLCCVDNIHFSWKRVRQNGPKQTLENANLV